MLLVYGHYKYILILLVQGTSLYGRSDVYSHYTDGPRAERVKLYTTGCGHV